VISADSSIQRFTVLLLAVAALLSAGCASTANPRDPLESVNRGIYEFNDAVDTVVMKPVAEAYRGVLPSFVRTSVRNFLDNIKDVLNLANNALQGKFYDALDDFGRIALNTTFGVAGLFDIASEAGLPKHDEDFGQTLGRWGVPSGPYVVLPFLGPSTLRDALALIVDWKTDPVTYVDPRRDRQIIWGVRIVSRRADLLDASNLLETAALDPYEFLRDAYIQRRRNQVYDGNPPPEKEDEDLPPPGPRSGQDAPAAAAAPVAETVPPPVAGDAQRGAVPAQTEDMAKEPPAPEKSPQRSAQVVRVWLPSPDR
jgi:phospholipid-binding lipoprotein MlaA